MTTRLSLNRFKVILGGPRIRVVSVAAQGPAGPANAPIADQTVLGNVSGGAAVPVALTAAQVKSLLAINTADVSGLGALASLDTVGGAQIDADAITSTKIAAGAVTLAKIAAIGAGVLLGSVAGGTPAELSAAQAKSLLAISTADVSGLGTAAVKNTGTSGNNVPLLDGANTWSAAQTIASGSIATSAPGLTLTQTWNGAGLAFTAISVAVTNTASTSASRLLSMTVGGSDIFYVTRDGVLTTASTVQSWGNLRSLIDGGVVSIGASSDVVLSRDAANVLALRNGTNAQMFRAYNTYTDASNYERFALDWKTTANWLRIATENAGTGAARNIALIPGGGIVGIGGTTSSDPALKKSSATLQVRLADDSGFASLAASSVTVDSSSGGAFLGGGYFRIVLQTSGGNAIGFQNAAGSDAIRLVLGLATSSYVSLKRSSATLQVRLGDDSGFAQLQGKLTTDTNYAAGTFTATGYLTLYDATGTAYRVPCAV